MWPIGHASIAYLCYTVSTRSRFNTAPASVAAVVVGFGSLFPDLVDKPLAWYLAVLPAGRTLAHSLLVLLPLSAVVYLAARRRGHGELAVAFGAGAVSHTLVDAAPFLWDRTASWEPLFWPLTPVGGYEGSAPSILTLFLDALSNPYFLSEFVFFGAALVLWRADGYPGIELLPLVGRTGAVRGRG